MEEFAAVILAAGKGKRMKSKLAKVLHPLCGKPMLFYVLKLVRELNPARTVVVVGKQREKVMDEFKEWKLEFAVQEELLGTGDAVLKTESALNGVDVDVLVLAGDTPLLKKATIERMLKTHHDTRAHITLLSAVVENPFGYGRIVRSGGKVSKIVEENDAAPEEKDIKEINAGVYLFDKGILFENLKKIKPDNKQNEYYLTDVVRMVQAEDGIVQAIVSENPVEIIGINDRQALARVEKIMREQQNDEEKEEKR